MVVFFERNCHCRDVTAAGCEPWGEGEGEGKASGIASELQSETFRALPTHTLFATCTCAFCLAGGMTAMK